MATNNKYDRQLRLWGAKGQKALSETCIVLVRATAAGTETLKNLVLPGIGYFHVVDDGNTGCTSAASNFFLPSKSSTNNNGSTSSTRAAVACEYLQELNPDVKGSNQHAPESLDSLSLDGWNSIFTANYADGGITKQKKIVIASDCTPPMLEKISQSCQESDTPLVVVMSYGLIGMVRIQSPPLVILDPKPTNAPPDLRLVNPIPGFVTLADSIEWDKLQDHEHGHIPYPLILYRAAKQWKESHGGELPKSLAQKNEFRKSIESMSRSIGKELNFQEAVQNAYLAYTERDLDYLLEENDNSGDPMYQGLVKALKLFMEKNNGRPPIHGSIPDMAASTEIYVKLQTVYRDQATKDVQEMKQYLQGVTVSDDDITTFCQNIFAIRQLRMQSIVDEYKMTGKPDEELVDEWNMATMDPYEVPEHTPLLWYLGLRSCQVFYDNHGRYPGTTTEWEKDIPLLQSCLSDTVIPKYQLQENELIQSIDLTKMASELTRYGNAEIHNIASVLGGVASQEAVKLITGQYVPFNNTYIYNGIASVGGVYQF